MKNAGEDLLHISVIPCGHLTTARQAGLWGVMAADEVDRDFPEQREILDGGTNSNPAVIFFEDDVEHPVQAILNLPMPAESFGQVLRVSGTAGQEVADVGFGLTCSVDAANAF